MGNTAKIKVNGTEKTLNPSQVEKYHKLKSGLLDSLVPTSQYPTISNEDLMEPEVDSFLMLLACSKAEKPKIDPTGLSLKTLKICYLLKKEGILPPFSLLYRHWGTTSSGVLTTAKILESLKTGNECTLLDILEEDVEEKYFLSAEQTQRILHKSKGDAKESESTERADCQAP